VTNTEIDLFFTCHTLYYYLHRALVPHCELLGPWQYASRSLPARLQKAPTVIPGIMYGAVPGTREAEDPVLLAAIPRTAEITARGEGGRPICGLGEARLRLRSWLIRFVMGLDWIECLINLLSKKYKYGGRQLIEDKANGSAAIHMLQHEVAV